MNYQSFKVNKLPFSSLTHHFCYIFLIIIAKMKINTNLSPIKLSPYSPYKKHVSPFKKFPPAIPKNQSQRHLGSPFKYINTDANPEIGKHLAQSAHTPGSSKQQIQQSPTYTKKQAFLNSIGARQKINTKHYSPLKIHQPKQKNKSLIKIRDRKHSINEFRFISKRTPHNKTQMQQEDEQLAIRDRKLSHQVVSTPQPISLKNQNHYQNYFSPQVKQFHKRDSDMIPNFTKSKPDFSDFDKIHQNSFYSPKNMTESSKKPTMFLKQPKLRKNSGQQMGKIQVPSFLVKRHKTFVEQEKVIFEPNLVKQKKFSLKDFTIMRQLGQGKFGKVLLVQQKKTKFICAMKVFKKSQIKNDKFIEQFIREMKIQLFLNHPNVIKMFGYFDDLSNIYILIQVACDGSLFSFIEERKQIIKNGQLQTISRFSTSNTLDVSKLSAQSSQSAQNITQTGLSYKQIGIVMYQLCTAINYLHSRNIIHRDLKPQNIVIHQKTIKLCDFGWSVFKGSAMRNTFCGTPLYLCPQLIVGDDYDQKVDIWAIGIMLYQLIIGSNPFKIKKQEDLANIVYQAIQIEANQAKIDLKARDLILGCLHKNPIERLNIKDIVQHSYFKQKCPELIIKVPRAVTSKVSDMMR